MDISSKANGWWTSNHCSDITAQRYVNMGKELYGSEPVFRAAVDQCAKLLEGLLPRPLLEATWGSAIGHRQGGASMMLRHASFLKQYYVFQGCVNFPFAYVSFTAPKSKWNQMPDSTVWYSYILIYVYILIVLTLLAPGAGVKYHFFGQYIKVSAHEWGMAPPYNSPIKRHHCS